MESVQSISIVVNSSELVTIPLSGPETDWYHLIATAGYAEGAPSIALDVTSELPSDRKLTWGGGDSHPLTISHLLQFRDDLEQSILHEPVYAGYCHRVEGELPSSEDGLAELLERYQTSQNWDVTEESSPPVDHVPFLIKTLLQGYRSGLSDVHYSFQIQGSQSRN